MKPVAYYNEFDRQKAAWLRHLIEEGVIAHGVVDERSISEVEADDLRGFAQCHFFAGVGVWSYALRLAGWPDDRPVWTGSCPCGPFSRAGKQEGFADPRHLWPVWLPLIRECRPDVLFGEQSDAADAWVDLVSSDLEDDGYAFGAPDIPAAGFGGAHIRQRFYWVADANNTEWWSERAPWHDGHWPKARRIESHRDAGYGSADSWLAYPHGGARSGRRIFGPREGDHTRNGPARERASGLRTSGRMVDSLASRLSDADLGIIRRLGGWLERGAAEQSGRSSGTGVDWLFCRDSLWRPVEPGTCPLVDASPARMGRLRGYGDAIDAEAATEFIAAYLENAPVRAAA